MGFEDVKTDNLSERQLKEQIKKYNEIYFGNMSFLADDGKEGQLGRYEKAEDQFRKEQKKAFKDYFTKLKWDESDESDDTMRANDEASVTFDPQLDRMSFKKSKEQIWEYRVMPISDFKQNPHYRKDRKNWKIVPNGGIPTKVQMLQKWVQDLKETVEANQKLNGQYNFRLHVNEEDAYGNCIGCEQKEYSDITEFLNEISDTKF